MTGQAIGIQRKVSGHVVRNGLALFSMFFGAGNIIFPLILGQTVSQNLFFALCGFFITAVIVPFTGVISTALYEGNYQEHFNRVGKFPAYLIILILFGLIGPFGGIPRLVGVCYSSLKVYLPELNLLSFSAVACFVILAFTARKNDVLKVLALVLTPILLIALLTIIVKGAFFSKATVHTGASLYPLKAFFTGIKEGYNTMDLLASFFFSSMIYKKIKGEKEVRDTKSFIMNMLKSCLVGAVLLGFVYVGFSYVATKYCRELSEVSSGQYLGLIGSLVLGKYAGILVCAAIIMACLTTAIALSALCADFIREQFPEKRRPSYLISLLAVLVTTWAVSTLEFSGIVKLLSPVLGICYPCLLVISILNIFYKFYGFKPIKFPVFATLVIMVFLSLQK